jgi:hypothetical protein
MTIEMNMNNGKLETSIEVGAYVAETPEEMLDLLDTAYEYRKMPEDILELYTRLDDLTGLAWLDLIDLALAEERD